MTERMWTLPRPDGGRHRKIAALAVAALASLTIGVFLHERSDRQDAARHHRELREHGVETTGRISRVLGLSVTIEILEGPYAGRELTKSFDKGMLAGSSPRTGEIVTVFHAPDDLGDNYVQGLPRGPGFSLFLAFFTLVAALLLIGRPVARRSVARRVWQPPPPPPPPPPATRAPRPAPTARARDGLGLD